MTSRPADPTRRQSLSSDGLSEGKHGEPSGPLRVLHVITSLARGGAQAHLLELIRGQKRRGLEIELAYFKDPVMVQEFAEVVPLPLQTNLGMGADPPAALLGRLWGLVSSFKPDVLHTHLLKADAYGAIAGHFGAARVTIASKHNDEAALRTWWISRVHGALSRLDDRVIVLSDHVGRYVMDTGRVPAHKIRRVYYGINLDRPIALSESAGRALRLDVGIEANAPFLLCVGRLDPQKGHPMLFEAMRQVVKAIPAARLLVVGGVQQASDTYAEHLRDLASAPDLAHVVRMVGERTDVPRLMAACDVFVLPSLWEGFGLVFAEAMAAGKPVIATNVSAIPEVVQNGETGVLVSPNDSDALASAIIDLLTNPAEQARLGANGYRRVREHFTAERMVDETIAIYHEALRERGTKAVPSSSGNGTVET